MAQLTGIVFIKVNSELLQSLPGATLDVGGYNRSAVEGYTLYGYTEQFKSAMVTCTVAHGANTDLTEMSGWKDVTITFECDSGPQYTIANAFVTKPAVLTAGADSNVALEFIGKVADQA